MLGFIADHFHFQPSELWEMDSWEMEFWFERARKLIEIRRG